MKAAASTSSSTAYIAGCISYLGHSSLHQSSTDICLPDIGTPDKNMDRLPSELLQMIFEYSSNEDIINLPYSISCKGLTEGELSRRFTVYRGIWIDEQSLKLLVRASNHPLIGITIQEYNSTSIEFPLCADANLEIVTGAMN